VNGEYHGGGKRAYHPLMGSNGFHHHGGGDRQDGDHYGDGNQGDLHGGCNGNDYHEDGDHHGDGDRLGDNDHDLSQICVEFYPEVCARDCAFCAKPCAHDRVHSDHHGDG